MQKIVCQRLFHYIFIKGEGSVQEDWAWGSIPVRQRQSFIKFWSSPVGVIRWGGWWSGVDGVVGSWIVFAQRYPYLHGWVVEKCGWWMERSYSYRWMQKVCHYYSNSGNRAIQNTIIIIISMACLQTLHQRGTEIIQVIGRPKSVWTPFFRNYIINNKMFCIICDFLQLTHWNKRAPRGYDSGGTPFIEGTWSRFLAS